MKKNALWLGDKDENTKFLQAYDKHKKISIPFRKCPKRME
jgi:hypothetical protein